MKIVAMTIIIVAKVNCQVQEMIKCTKKPCIHKRYYTLSYIIKTMVISQQCMCVSPLTFEVEALKKYLHRERQNRVGIIQLLPTMVLLSKFNAYRLSKSA